MEINKETIERIWYFSTWSCDFALFRKIYTRGQENPDNQHSLANHMWRKFKDCDNNFLVFFRQNDLGNQKAIIDYLNSKEFDTTFKRDMN